MEIRNRRVSKDLVDSVSVAIDDMRVSGGW